MLPVSTGVSENKTIIGFRVRVVVEPDDEGFHAYCPALKGLHTYGESEKDALANARDAAIAYLRSCIKHGDPIPVGIVVNEENEPGVNSHKKGIHQYTEDLAITCAI
jgi:predicted RNase H-like HicB family nuclease